MTTPKKPTTKAAAKATTKAASTKTVVADNAIKLRKKEADLLEELSASMNKKPENVILEALETLKRLEESRKKWGFGSGKLREAT